MTVIYPAPTPAPEAARPIALALEGGGALGAFTWGVLDRLLDVPDLRFDVVSGASAGAMNGAMLVQGLVSGGPDGAKRLLETFWQRVSMAAGSFPGPAAQWLNVIAGTMAPMLEAMRRSGPMLGADVSNVGAFSFGLLRGILSEMLHPPLFDRPDAPELVVAATSVRTGAARLFRRGEVSIDALLASACLPQLFPAIEIDGEAYWDGGYSSNPPVRALLQDGGPADVLIVRTTAPSRLGLPHGAAEVKERVNEITFGTPLRAELRSLALAQASLAELDDLPAPLARLRGARLHMIAPSPADAETGADALNPTWPLLAEQRKRGYIAADAWVEAHLGAVGHRSSFELQPYADLAPTALSHPILEGTANAT